MIHLKEAGWREQEGIHTALTLLKIPYTCLMAPGQTSCQLLLLQQSSLSTCSMSEGLKREQKGLFTQFVSGQRCLVTVRYLLLNELLTLFWMHLHQVELGRN